jgi:hypothetical protein
LPYFFGLDGIWSAFPAADCGSSMLTGVWFLLELRRLDKGFVEAAKSKAALAPHVELP